MEDGGRKAAEASALFIGQGGKKQSP